MPKSKVKWCIRCHSPAGPRSDVYCDYHAGYHAGHSKALMSAKRAASPEYREDERNKVRARMRKIRARPPWLFTKDSAREMGIKRWVGVSDAERKRLARKAAKASGLARRKQKLARLKAGTVCHGSAVAG